MPQQGRCFPLFGSEKDAFELYNSSMGMINEALLRQFTIKSVLAVRLEALMLFMYQGGNVVELTHGYSKLYPHWNFKEMEAFFGRLSLTAKAILAGGLKSDHSLSIGKVAAKVWKSEESKREKAALEAAINEILRPLEDVQEGERPERDFAITGIGGRRTAAREIKRETCPACERERELIKSSKDPALRICGGCFKKLGGYLRKGKLRLDDPPEVMIAFLNANLTKAKAVEQMCSACQERPAKKGVRGGPKVLCKACSQCLEVSTRKGEISYADDFSTICTFLNKKQEEAKKSFC